MPRLKCQFMLLAVACSWMLASEALACPACAAAAKGGSCAAGAAGGPAMGFYAGDGAEPLAMPQEGEAPTYDLGEAAPAQTGNSLAVADQPGGFMIGDLFSNPYAFSSPYNNFHPLGSLSLAAGDRRFKISENTSPIPRDRIYFTYNHFQNALVNVNGRELNLNRYTFGGEKTFLDGLASLEVRVPFASGLATNQIEDGISGNDGTAFGNVTLIPKAVLAAGDTWLLSTGVGINLPTAPSISMESRFGDITTVQNDAVHLLPFLGMYLAPTSNSYVIGYLQADFDANGNAVTREFSGTTLSSYTLQDQTLMHADLAIGHWIHRNPESRLTGIAPQLELHYTTTLQNADYAFQTVEPLTDRFDLLTITGGINFQFYRTFLTVACAVPLRGGSAHPEEHQYDFEGQVLLNRVF